MFWFSDSIENQGSSQVSRKLSLNSRLKSLILVSREDQICTVNLLHIVTCTVQPLWLPRCINYCKLILFPSDFSNFIGKPSIRAIAEADDHEVVREVQVIIGIHSSVKVSWPTK